MAKLGTNGALDSRWHKRMKRSIFLLLSTLLAGCFPVHKTLQPGSAVTVQDEAGMPIAGATVTLIANAYPYGFEKTRVSLVTGVDGIAEFPEVKDWRIEVLMLHGAEQYFWNWCVMNEGYATYATDHSSARDFDEGPLVVLERGQAGECPTYN